jgi:hypothetical protein
MILIKHNQTNEYNFVNSLNGYELQEWTVILENLDPEEIQNKRWSEALQALEEIPSGVLKTISLSLDQDSRWSQMKSATPTQIETYIQNNVTDLASAKQVLIVFAKVLRLLAVKGNI